MARYVDIDDIIKTFEKLHGEESALLNCYNADWIVSFLEAQPTADVQEVRHGEWDFDGIGWTCSECGEYALKARVQKCSKFCPKCGAKMDGKE